MNAVTTKAGTCNWCGAKVELDVSTGPGVWIDEDVQDSANEGARCPVSDSGWHEVAESVAIFYTGRDKRGVAHGGQASVKSVTEFVETRHKAGWQFLVVADNTDRERRVGAVEGHPQTGKRTWWAES